MLASEMIKQLTELVAEHGDWKVYIPPTCDDTAEVEEVSWNGPIDWAPNYIPNFSIR